MLSLRFEIQVSEMKSPIATAKPFSFVFGLSLTMQLYTEDILLSYVALGRTRELNLPFI
jgi:hypothetical protein